MRGHTLTPVTLPTRTPALRRGRLAAALGAAALALVLPASAGAAACSPTTGAASCTISGTATITGGSLTVEAPATMSWAATLTGFTVYADQAATLEPIDATGSSSGWDATVTSTTFTTGAKTLPTTALSVNGSGAAQSATSAPTASCAAGSSCVLPTQTTSPVTYPLTVPAGASAPTAVPLYTADASSGEGAVDLDSDWWLTVPSAAATGSYTNTITLAINSGP